MAPIRWTGNTSTQVNSFMGDDLATVTGITNSLNVNANSFIVAPWLGQWTAGFGRTAVNINSSGTGVKAKSESVANTINGGVTLVPTSEFPFAANFAHSWSAGNGDASATSFDLNQKYRTTGGDNYSASYSSATLRNGNQKNEFSALRGDYSTRREFEYEHFLEGVHLLSASFNYIPETAVTNGGKGNLLDSHVTHDWRVHEDLSINNRLTLRNSSLTVLQGNALQRNDSILLLGTSNFNWRPFEDEPLFLSGGASLLHVETDTGIDTPTEQDSFNAYVSGTYTFSKNLTANAGVFANTVTASQSGSASSSGTSRFSNLSGNAGVGYSGDTITLGSFLYNWNVSGGLDSRLDIPGEILIGAKVAAGHSLSRTIVIDPTQSVGLSFAQGGSFGTTTNLGVTTALTHNAGLNWNSSFGDGLSTGVAANLSHAVSSDDNSSNNQSLSMSVGGNLNYRYQFSARANATLTGALNWLHNRFDNVQNQTLNQLQIDNTDTRYNANLIATYSHFAPFSVPNLQYDATFLLNFSDGGSGVSSVGLGARPSSRFGRNLNVSAPAMTTTLQQNLRYRVGRLSFNASASVINTGNGTSYSLFGSMNREFNGFFDGRW